MRSDFRSELVAVDEERRADRGNEQETYKNGVTTYICTAQIEQPRDLVERRNQHTVGM